MKQEEDDVRLKRILAILTAAVSIIMLLLGWRYLFGFLIGDTISVFVYLNTVHYVDETIRLGIPAGSRHQVLNYIMWTGVLILCALLPDYLNILSCAFGLFMIRISLLTREFIYRKE